MSILDRFKKNKEGAEKGSVAKQVVKAEQKDEKKKPKKATKAEEPKKEKKAVQIISKKATHTLIEPIVTEKSAQLSDRGVIVFKVAEDANRVTVRNAFRELYKITPVKVNVMNVRGKSIRFGRTTGQTQNYKKAIITLPEGKRIDVFEGV